MTMSKIVAWTLILKTAKNVPVKLIPSKSAVLLGFFLMGHTLQEPVPFKE
jgi:hypothetical protein